MKQLLLTLTGFTLVFSAGAQQNITPEALWRLGRVTAVGITENNQNVVYTVSTPDMETNKSNKKTYMIPVGGGQAKEIAEDNPLIRNDRVAPGGKHIMKAGDVKIQKVFGKDYYPELDKSNVQIYNQLGYRHWDEWEDGAFSHIFVSELVNGKAVTFKDIMSGMPYDCPQKPSGDKEDFIWSPDGNSIVYVTKPKSGTAYALSTNTDILQYSLKSGETINLTEGMSGYDTHPAFSATGTLAWLSMKRDGYEADKQDIVVTTGAGIINLTQHWDGSVSGFKWSNNGRDIFFYAPIDGTLQLFSVDYPGLTQKVPEVKQITHGDFDVNAIAGQIGNKVFVNHTDMNHAAELYSVDLTSGVMKQLTHVNDNVYKDIAMGRAKRRYVSTTDGKKMLVWVIYPPGFDSTKKYPAVLYCQGGPQSPLTQMYSFRWNFALMSSGGYIIVAPNRRGMYGHGREWNEQITKDWGGQVMADYLSAIDDVSKEAYVDKSRLGCVGPSFGGYSSFYLAGIHNNRFKTFISHDGLFDLRSMSGTTEELWFTNWENGGYYWDKDNKEAQKTFTRFNPIEYVAKWNRPILIIQGGRDYRVPVEQGLQAFQAAQLLGLKSRLLYFPDENHWVLKPRNALIWQREFFKWLKETL